VPENFQTVSPETVWKIARGFLNACVLVAQEGEMGHFVSFWPLANTPDREAYSEFPDSLWKRNSRKSISTILHTPSLLDRPALHLVGLNKDASR
jgi:hypothetical protein